MDFKAGFDHIKPMFPPALVSDQYKLRITAIASLFKTVAVVSIECRLSKEDDGVDLAIGFETDVPNDRFGIFFQIPKNEIEKISGNDNRLDNILQFFIAPSQSQQFLKESIQGFWLNFDLSEGNTIPLPWIYLVFREIKLGAAFYATLLKKTFLSVDLNYDQPTLDRMEDVVKALPDHAYLLGVAIPTQASQRTFRVVICGMTFGQILIFLKNIQWPGDLVDLASKLGPGCALCNKLGLLLDFSNGELLAKVGIEMLIQQDNAIHHVDQLLKFMIGLEVCDPSKAHRVNEWICRAVSTEDPPAHQVPVQRLNQWINHFKLVYEPGKPIEAKCYFGSSLRK